MLPAVKTDRVYLASALVWVVGRRQIRLETLDVTVWLRCAEVRCSPLSPMSCVVEGVHCHSQQLEGSPN